MTPEERQIEYDFEAALAANTIWELADEGTLETALMCRNNSGHRERFQTREDATAFLNDNEPCDRCAELDELAVHEDKRAWMFDH